MNKDKPYYFLEMVTALVVVAILLAGGVPKWRGQYKDYKIEEEVHRTVNNLIVARNTAIETRHNVFVRFNPGTASYQIHEDLNGNRKPDPQEPAREVYFKTGLQFGVDPRVQADNIWGTQKVGQGPVEFSPPQQEIFFNSKGQASGDGAIYVRGPLKKDEETQMWAIRILRASGEIDEFDYTPGKNPPWVDK